MWKVVTWKTEPPPFLAQTHQPHLAALYHETKHQVNIAGTSRPAFLLPIMHGREILLQLVTTACSSSLFYMNDLEEFPRGVLSLG